MSTMVAASGVSGTFQLPPAVVSILTPPEDLTVSVWCDRYRYLNRKYAAEPGLWSTARTPYLREPLDALADPAVGELIFIKCSRIGGTEWLNNLIAFSIDARPLPIMYAQPERPAVEDEFRGRLRSMIEDSPKLRAHIAGGEWASGVKINLDAVEIHGAWAENPRTMIRKTIGVAIFDEIDNCEKNSGGLGNTLDVLRERLVTFGYRAKLIADGTPTTSDASGWRMLLASDHRKPHVPCPHCGTYQVLSFAGIRLKPGHEKQRDPDRIEAEQLAGYECGHCHELIEHAAWHRWMIDRVIWVPKTQTVAERLPVSRAGGNRGRGRPGSRGSREIVERRALAIVPDGVERWTPKLEGDPPTGRTRGYWINVLYSPWESRTWSHIFAQFLRVKDDPEKLRVFNNSWLAEPWEDAVELTRYDELAAKRDAGGPEHIIPPAARLLLMGVDVQLDHFYYVIRAWGPWETSWLIRHGTCETFDQLYEIAFFTGYPMAGAPGRNPQSLVRCHALAIDSGYRTDEIYEFGRRPGVEVVKGVDTADYRVKPSRVEYQPRGRVHPMSLVLHLVNTSLFKGKVHRLAKLAEDQPGAWGLHREATDDYLKQFTAEHQVWVKSSSKKGAKRKLVWKPRVEGAANHYLDAEVYGAALADLCHVPLLRDHSPVVGVMEEPAGGGGERRSKKASPGTGTGFGGGWLSR